MTYAAGLLGELRMLSASLVRLATTRCAMPPNFDSVAWVEVREASAHLFARLDSMLAGDLDDADGRLLRPGEPGYEALGVDDEGYEALGVDDQDEDEDEDEDKDEDENENELAR